MYRLTAVMCMILCGSAEAQDKITVVVPPWSDGQFVEGVAAAFDGSIIIDTVQWQSEAMVSVALSTAADRNSGIIVDIGSSPWLLGDGVNHLHDSGLPLVVAASSPMDLEYGAAMFPNLSGVSGCGSDATLVRDVHWFGRFPPSMSDPYVSSLASAFTPQVSASNYDISSRLPDQGSWPSSQGNDSYAIAMSSDISAIASILKASQGGMPFSLGVRGYLAAEDATSLAEIPEDVPYELLVLPDPFTTGFNTGIIMKKAISDGELTASFPYPLQCISPSTIMPDTGPLEVPAQAECCKQKLACCNQKILEFIVQ